MAAGGTYEPIATSTVSTPVATITFSSIPSTYTDLKVIMNLSDDDAEAGTGAPTFTFNNDSSALYSQVRVSGRNDATLTTSLTTGQTKIYALFWNNSPTSTTIFPLMIVDIFSYAGSSNKSCLITAADDRGASPTLGAVERMVGLYRSTTAISRMDITNDGNKKFETGSIVTIYGIKAA